MVKKSEINEQALTVVDNLMLQIDSLQDTNQNLIQIINTLTDERRQQLARDQTDGEESEQRAYELMAQLMDKVTNQRNAAYRKINSVIKNLIR